ncbi:uncharacterized protein MONBRDRAFT_25650 [Monosiga brevicollis MX1]|uniref:RING-type E3 ubiquitin transferase BRCA1 n=1 Tax=Monosiga brevicollis TaxID=81824 RepID=A9V009_MONBE|nr:uncharacterized protein MONBRDRAFT_25650 [Monosiga brevicollis MX1]EDQ88929.1 predicted protein [Monosiga brevicollis MX1]|eukprot:XP_001746034.1 hypothetical protein [Monosiga brevicollis MX1]
MAGSSLVTAELKQHLQEFEKALQCAICLGLLEDPLRTGCHHEFCRGCLHSMLASSRSTPCPLCKTPVTKRYALIISCLLLSFCVLKSLNECPSLSQVIQQSKHVIVALNHDLKQQGLDDEMADVFPASQLPGMQSQDSPLAANQNTPIALHTTSSAQVTRPSIPVADRNNTKTAKRLHVFADTVEPVPEQAPPAKNQKTASRASRQASTARTGKSRSRGNAAADPAGTMATKALATTSARQTKARQQRRKKRDTAQLSEEEQIALAIELSRKSARAERIHRRDSSPEASDVEMEEDVTCGRAVPQSAQHNAQSWSPKTVRPSPETAAAQTSQDPLIKTSPKVTPSKNKDAETEDEDDDEWAGVRPSRHQTGAQAGRLGQEIANLEVRLADSDSDSDFDLPSINLEINTSQAPPANANLPLPLVTANTVAKPPSQPTLTSPARGPVSDKGPIADVLVSKDSSRSSTASPLPKASASGSDDESVRSRPRGRASLLARNGSEALLSPRGTPPTISDSRPRTHSSSIELARASPTPSLAPTPHETTLASEPMSFGSFTAAQRIPSTIDMSASQSGTLMLFPDPPAPRKQATLATPAAASPSASSRVAPPAAPPQPEPAAVQKPTQPETMESWHESSTPPEPILPRPAQRREAPMLDQISATMDESQALEPPSTAGAVMPAAEEEAAEPLFLSGIVLLASGSGTGQSNGLDIESLLTRARACGAQVCHEFAPSVTHVIGPAKEDGVAAQYTMKLMLGLLHQKWLVSWGWLDRSLASGTRADEATYELRRMMAEVERDGIPAAARLDPTHQAGRLFRGICFALSDKAVGEVGETWRDEVLAVIRATGATLKSEREVLDIARRQAPADRDCFVIGSESTYKMHRTDPLWAEAAQLDCLVELYWITDSIAHLELQAVEEYLLNDEIFEADTQGTEAPI